MSEWEGFEDDAACDRRLNAGCGIGKLLLSDTLSEEAKDHILRAFARPELTHSGIARALKVRMGPSGPNAWVIGRHRRGDCQCTEE